MDKDIITKVYKAIENHEIKAYYQPKYDSITNRLVGAEALVRWIKEEGNIIMPGNFIPILENTKDIMVIDWYMLEEVCKLLNKQQKQNISSVPIAVNFSRMHIYEEDFIDKLCKIVNCYNLPYNLIEIEITESAFTVSSQKVIDLIEKIHNAGFRVAIDDFGSGLSSLSMIKDVCVDVIKIDKSLLDGNCENEKERIVLESIFDFAHRLKLITVAEGVETIEQLSFLRTCSCQIIQGFIYSKPLPELEFSKLFNNKNNIEPLQDILMIQAPTRTTELLLEAVFMRFPLIIFSNLTKNSYYMLSYDNFTCTKCSSTGIFDELIEDGTSTMHPDDKELFKNTFSRKHLISLNKEGIPYVRIVTRQLGDDKIYRKVETTDYFVKNPSSKDVLVITMSQIVE